jgi:hypothetical protein
MGVVLAKADFGVFCGARNERRPKGGAISGKRVLPAPLLAGTALEETFPNRSYGQVCSISHHLYKLILIRGFP